jgi:predicted amidohydrolase
LSFTIRLAQIVPQLGAVEANLERHLRLAEEAAAEGVDVLCFPALSLTGNVLRDLAADVALPVERGMPAIDALLEAGRALDLVVGLIEIDRRGRYYATSLYLSAGEILHRQRQVYPFAPGLGAPATYLATGQGWQAFDTRFGRFGLLSGGDAHHLAAPYLLWLDGADLLLVQAAEAAAGQPAGATTAALCQGYASSLTAYVACCNRAGVEEGYAFLGESTLYGPDGAAVQRGPRLEEALVTATVDPAAVRRVRTANPLLAQERPEILLRQVDRLLREAQP